MVGQHSTDIDRDIDTRITPVANPEHQRDFILVAAFGVA